uniref:RING-type domain-containing protein n=1 Tax=Anopheles atroparvus TaxID=41427 RepID=A0AAG5D416_ANOAO
MYSKGIDFICIVCMKPLIVRQSVATTCGHVFHRDCILHWMRTKQICPQCRSTKPLKLRLIRWTFPAIPDVESESQQFQLEPIPLEEKHGNRNMEEDKMLETFDSHGDGETSEVCPRFDYLLHKAINLRAKLNDIQIAKETQPQVSKNVRKTSDPAEPASSIENMFSTSSGSKRRRMQ